MKKKNLHFNKKKRKENKKNKKKIIKIIQKNKKFTTIFYKNLK